MEPERQVAVVTGCAGGLGLEIARHLLQKGFHVAATDLDKRLNELRYSVHSERLQCFALDVSDLDRVKQVALEISNSFALPVTVLVNNAGVFSRHPVTKADFSETARNILEVNLLGAFHCTEIFCKSMISAKYGRIINIASLAGIFGAGHGSAYAASKAGLIAATRSWARELAPFGVNVNAIAPGIFENPMVDQQSIPRAQAQKLIVSAIPAKRMGNPADVGELVAFLATCATNYINGVVIEVDGGVHVPGVEEVREL